MPLGKLGHNGDDAYNRRGSGLTGSSERNSNRASNEICLIDTNEKARLSSSKYQHLQPQLVAVQVQVALGD